MRISDWSADVCSSDLKLAPRVSPGKTWEGAVGGVVAATLWVVVSSFWEGSFGFVLRQYWPWAGVLVISVALAALSIAGDILESLIKRRAGVKDYSGLLPGHGGVYEWIDALLLVVHEALWVVVGLHVRCGTCVY